MIDIRVVQKNIFPGAHDTIWQAFPWHRGAASPHSSQALAVSIFGTLATHPARQALIDETVRLMFGWEPLSPSDWRVRLEMTLPHGLLGERRPTQIDVLLDNESGIVMLECKFNEAGGPCSQARPRPSGKHAGLIQCNGNYKMQKNPINGKEARCALLGKGIRYWDLLPSYFTWARDRDYEPCPFAGPAFQYMRNTLGAARWAEQRSLERAAFGLIYVAGEQFPMSSEVTDPNSEWNEFVRHLRPEAALTIKAMSYQQLLEAWHQRLPQDQVLADLATWVKTKVQAVQPVA